MSAPGTNVPVVSSPLLMLDYDGTLADIVANPDEAYPHPRVRELLEALAQRHPVFVITGRQVKDIAAFLPVSALRIVGVHGMEEGVVGGETKTLVGDEARAGLEWVRTHPPNISGLGVEDKGSAVAFHYRNVEDAGVEEALRDWSAGAPDTLDRLWGKKVLELRPKGHSKGSAVARLVEEHPGTTPVFIGDDTTDEEAFEVLGEGVTVKVGEGETNARHRLEDVEAVVGYLERYL